MATVGTQNEPGLAARGGGHIVRLGGFVRLQTPVRDDIWQQPDTATVIDATGANVVGITPGTYVTDPDRCVAVRGTVPVDMSVIFRALGSQIAKMLRIVFLF